MIGGSKKNSGLKVFRVEEYHRVFWRGFLFPLK